MEMTGTQTIRLGQSEVWKALNDPAVLQQCIPGCESFEAAGEDQYQIVMVAAVGPVKARFKGKLSLSDIRPPSSYSLSFSGSGGAAGTGKGTAQVSLAPAADGTELQYSVKAQVGGRLAQVGSRLIDSVAGKMADEFFNRFKAAVEAPSAAQAAAAPPPADAPQAPKAAAAPAPAAAVPPQAETRAPAPQSSPWKMWMIAALAVLIGLGSWLATR